MRNILLFILLMFSVSTYANTKSVFYCYKENHRVVIDLDMDRMFFDDDSHTINHYLSKQLFITNNYVNTAGVYVYQMIGISNDSLIHVYTFNVVKNSLIGHAHFSCKE